MIETPPSSVDVVLPCLDEAEALPRVLERIPPGWRAVVVDNGSTDGSPDVARERVRGPRTAARLRRRVPRGPRRRHGRRGLLLRPRRLPRPLGMPPTVAGPVLDGAADLVLGRRRPTARRAWPGHARLANLEPARLVRRRTGVHLHDLGPVRAARREALLTLTLSLTDRRSGYPLQMVVRAADAG